MPLALFPADRQLPNFAAGFGVQVRLKEMELHRPRQWGACWLACYLYEQLGLDEFWAEHLPDSREGTCWGHILETLVCYRLIDPGSEWRLHRQWFEQSAMADLLDEDYSLVEKNSLYRCLDKVLKHKEQLFGRLRQRWQDLFGARFEVLLYDLTSTYFESDPVFEETDKRQFGYSRDKRSDCVQTLVFVGSVQQASQLARRMRATGVRAEYVAGKRLDSERNESILARYQSDTGDVDVLMCCLKLGEGVDLPHTRTVFLTTPTTSEIRVRQMLGRALRGPAVGGTEVANLVAFLDDGQLLRDWRDPFTLVPDLAKASKHYQQGSPRPRLMSSTWPATYEASEQLRLTAPRRTPNATRPCTQGGTFSRPRMLESKVGVPASTRTRFAHSTQRSSF